MPQHHLPFSKFLVKAANANNRPAQGIPRSKMSARHSSAEQESEGQRLNFLTAHLLFPSPT